MVNNLSAPAHAQNTPFVNLIPRLLSNLLDHRWNLGYRRWWGSGSLKEGTEFLTLLGSVRREPRERSGVSAENVRDKDLILVMLVIGMSEDVSALLWRRL